jgi:hypothetical protein
MGVNLEKWRKLPTGLTSHIWLFYVAYDGLPTVIDVDVLDANVLFAHHDEAVEALRPGSHRLSITEPRPIRAPPLAAHSHAHLRAWRGPPSLQCACRPFERLALPRSRPSGRRPQSWQARHSRQFLRCRQMVAGPLLAIGPMTN